MKSVITATELADLKVSGFPATERGIRKMADREGWPTEKRNARGGGSAYAVTAILKSCAGASHGDLIAKLTTTPSTAVVVQPSRVAVATPTTLADWQRNCADARAAILLEVERIAAVAGVSRAIECVVALAASGELRTDLQELVPFANARGGAAGSRTLSRRTLFRWRTENARGVEALTPTAPAPAKIPAWGAALLRLYNSPTQKSLAAILECDLPSVLPENVPCPTYDAARRFLKRMSIVDRERGRSGPQGLLKHKAFKRRSTDALQPLDVVTADGHAFKADVAHPVHGRPFRPEVCAIQDVTTRYVFGWSAGLAESATVVMDTIRSGVEHLGMFGIFYTDNGSGFVSDAMTAEVTGFLARLHATPKNSIPGRAQSRGKIERLQATLWKRAARQLPTFNSRDMDNEARRKVVKIVRSEIKAYGASRFLLSWDEFLTFARNAVEAYNNRPHRSLPKFRDEETGKMRHMSPAECLAHHRSKGWEPVTLSPEAAADLWRPYEIRTTARGEVKLPWGRYFSKALESFGGERVRVGYDIHDGTRVWVRTLEHGQLICVAIRDGNVTPEQPASLVEHARQRRADGRLKLLAQHAEEVRAEMGPGLIEHKAEVPFNAAIAERQREIEAEYLNPVSVPVLDTRRTRFMRALEIEQAEAAGLPISDEDTRWHRAYSSQPEYRTAKMMFEDFGEAALEA